MSSGKNSAKRARHVEEGEPPSEAFDGDKPASAIGLYAEMMLRYVSKGNDVEMVVKRLDKFVKRREKAARENSAERTAEPARSEQPSAERAAEPARSEQPRAGKSTPPPRAGKSPSPPLPSCVAAAGTSATAAVATGPFAAATAACQAAARGSSTGEPRSPSRGSATRSPRSPSRGSATRSSPRRKSPWDATLVPVKEQPLDGTQQRDRMGGLQAARARSPAPRLADDEGDQDQDQEEEEPDSAKASSRGMRDAPPALTSNSVNASPTPPKKPRKPRVLWFLADAERLKELCPTGKLTEEVLITLTSALGPRYGLQEIKYKLKHLRREAARPPEMDAPNP
jgi:hypothetical protein